MRYLRKPRGYSRQTIHHNKEDDTYQFTWSDPITKEMKTRDFKSKKEAKLFRGCIKDKKAQLRAAKKNKDLFR